MDKIYPVMRRHKMLIFIPSLAMVLALGLDFFNPLLTRAIVDRVIIGGERDLMVPIIGALLAVTLVRAVLGYTKEYLFDYFSTKVIAQLKDDTFSHILSQNFKYFDSMNTGELMSRMSEDVENVWNAVGYGIRLIIENILYFLLAFFVLMYFHWQLTLICLVI
ncbi:MAG TPA: ABC transporter transmembrane domain-containing protein, partial [Clostridiaceae bacterium]|nr:ABC transporter transmembrane domain-containing protein [Clostridiaceae bacterium]